MTTIIHFQARSLATMAFLVSIISTGCVQVTFLSPMPPNKPNLNSFPEKWQGEWMATEEEDEAHMSVHPSHIFFDDGLNELIVNSSCLVRKMGRKLVISLPQEDGERYSVYIAKIRSGTLTIQSFDPDGENSKELWEDVLGDDRVVLKHKEEEGDRTRLVEVQLNPKNRWQFRRLVKHGATELTTFVKIDPDDLKPTPN